MGWYNRWQDIVSISVTEAEYIADCEDAKDAGWICQFLNELRVTMKPVLKMDCEGAYNLSKAARFARRSRLIEHRYHYLRQQVRMERLEIRTIPGRENPADLLTKLLPMTSVNAGKANGCRHPSWKSN